MGGHGLYATVPDYMKFIRMWLNDGAGSGGRVLKPETVRAAVQNGLQAHQHVVMLPGVIPSLSNDAEFFPGLKKSWCYTFMINDSKLRQGDPQGRSAGPVSATCFSGSTDRTASGVFGARKSCRSAIRHRSVAISISRPKRIAGWSDKRPLDVIADASGTAAQWKPGAIIE